MKLQPYPAYKDSGVPWLGQVPAHWSVCKQRQVVDMLVSNVDKHSFENELPVRLCNYVHVYKHDRITEQLPFMRATATTEEIERYRLRRGDVIITKDSESWTDIGVPALVEYTADDLICGYHLAILRPQTDKVGGEYLLWAAQCQGVASQYFVSANGVTRYGLTHQGIKNVQLPIPPLPEQHAIARFLDHLDRRVNRYIRAKRRLIALLNEQKQAIIHRAVTRGLDPDAPLKPSGIEWLGEIPAHWEVSRLAAFTCSFQTGPFGTQLHSHDYEPGGTPVINPSHMKGGRVIADPRVAIGEKKLVELSHHRLIEGDIILARRGELGRCALITSKEEGWICGTGSLRMRIDRNRVEESYLVQVLASTGVGSWLSTRAFQ